MTGATGREAPPDAYGAAVRAARGALATAGGFSAVINVLMLTGSIYMLQVYDRVLASGSVATLMGLFAIVIVLHVFLGFFDAMRARLMARAAVRLDRQVGAAALRQAVGAGQGGSALRELDTLRQFLSSQGAFALFDAPWVPLYFAVLFLVHPTIGWLAVGGAGVAVALAALNHALTRGPIGRTLAREAAERDLADRARRGAEVVRAMGMQTALARRWQGLRDAALAAGQASGDPADVLAATSRAIRMLLQSAILTAGAWLTIRGEMTAGMIVAASIVSGRALAPVDQVVGNWRAIRRAGLAHAALRQAFAALPPEPPRLSLPEPRGRLDVAGLAKFAAPHAAGGGGERRPLLDGVSFALEPGDALGVIGPSGSGKSTLARLLVGAAASDRGEVRLDGATYPQWDPARLGRHLGYLPQSPDPLGGSVRDVIARFDPTIPDDAVLDAAQLTGIHDLILALPDGYDTVLGGEGGFVLSGGQAQRLGLARAVCGPPRLVVLDEPNAHLDAAGDEALGHVVGALRAAGSAVVVVSHRPGVLAAVNKVLVLDAGRVLRFGDAAEVLATEVAASGPRVAPLVAAMPPRTVAARMQRLAQRREARRSADAGPSQRVAT